jgi:hypothetical protein
MIIGDKKMKTKIMVGGLLAVIMLVTLPILTASVNETTSAITNTNETNVEETPTIEKPEEETPKEEKTEEAAPKAEETPKKIQHYAFAYVKATFSVLNEWEFEYNNGKLFFTDIVIDSKDDALNTALKINGDTIVRRGTPVKITIDTMSILAFRPQISSIVAMNPSYRIVLSGFASGITVTY